MSADYKRSDRVADLIQQEISDLLLRRVKDPRTAGVTITGVKVSADLQHATIHFCVMESGTTKGRDQAAAGLDKAKGFIRQELGKRMHMKHLPQLEFRYDTSFDYGDKIERLLRQIHHDE